ncbi:hypothetical protein MPLB_1080040 [Mesorhizobium sp. ORS 3324]|nr:hypothetical protein MPLB_1080040 [Mesorhizobium sp. ORS 3324]
MAAVECRDAGDIGLSFIWATRSEVDRIIRGTAEANVFQFSGA